MKALLGQDYPAFLASTQRPPCHGLRVNTLKSNPVDFQKSAPFDLTPIPWCPQGFYYPSHQRPGLHPYHAAGVYYLQEPSAMAVAGLLQPRPGERVADLCAAPGGKSTQIAALMNNSGLLLANEIHPTRAKILSQNVERLGIQNTIVTQMDTTAMAQRFPGFFDRVLADAPCSGEGMFRKDETAINEWSEENVLRCAARQDEILSNAAQLLRPGGRLVYSTCTFAPEENEGTIDRFLKDHPDFSLEHPLEIFSPGCPSWVEGNKELTKTYRLFPHRLTGEGHFIAVLKKAEGEAQPLPLVHRRPLGRSEQHLWQAFADQYLADVSVDSLLQFGDHLYALPACSPDLNGIVTLRPGWHLGTLKKNRFGPSQALAMGLRPHQAAKTLPVDPEEAQQYLSGQVLPCSGSGWTLVTLDGFSLGWGKASGGQLKNHYPKGLRIHIKNQK